MKVKNILNETAIAIQGNLNQYNLDVIKLVCKNNKNLFKQFNMVTTIFNKSVGVDDSDMSNLNKLLKENYNCFTLIDWANRGHQFGYIDLDKSLFSFIKDNFNHIKYIFKVDADYLVKENFLELEIDEDTDFFYQPSINIPDLHKYGDNESYYNNFIKDDYEDIRCPQANNYIMSTKINFPYEKSDDIKKAYDKWIEKGYTKVNQNIAIACEHSLSKSIKRNNFKRQMMFTKETFFKVMDFIVKNNIGDTTLKNIYLSDIGFCHWQFPNQEVITC